MRKFIVSYFIDNSIDVHYEEITVSEGEKIDLDLIKTKVKHTYNLYTLVANISVIAWSLID